MTGCHTLNNRQYSNCLLVVIETKWNSDESISGDSRKWTKHVVEVCLKSKGKTIRTCETTSVVMVFRKGNEGILQTGRCGCGGGMGR